MTELIDYIKLNKNIVCIIPFSISKKATYIFFLNYLKSNNTLYTDQGYTDQDFTEINLLNNITIYIKELGDIINKNSNCLYLKLFETNGNNFNFSTIEGDKMHNLILTLSLNKEAKHIIFCKDKKIIERLSNFTNVFDYNYNINNFNLLKSGILLVNDEMKILPKNIKFYHCIDLDFEITLHNVLNLYKITNNIININYYIDGNNENKYYEELKLWHKMLIPYNNEVKSSKKLIEKNNKLYIIN